MLRFRLLVVAILTGITALDAHAQQDPPKPGTAVASGARLQPGDIVRLRIWREPDLSGDFTVDRSGSVVFPKIGRMDVAADSPATLTTQLVQAYSRYLRNPSIDVVLLRRVNVLGAVKTPGLYPADPTMTVSDVLALAGGVAPQGRPDRVLLIRDGHSTTVRVATTTPLTDIQLESGDQLYVPERSWLSRNKNVISATISAGVSLFIALAIRR